MKKLRLESTLEVLVKIEGSELRQSRGAKDLVDEEGGRDNVVRIRLERRDGGGRETKPGCKGQGQEHVMFVEMAWGVGLAWGWRRDDGRERFGTDTLV